MTDEEISINADVPIEDIDENTQDLTVYDLAEKIAAGRILTASANAEIEDKLVEIHTGLRTLIANTAPVDTPKETAVALLHFRDFLRKLIAPT